jgi:hypothetical protein
MPTKTLSADQAGPLPVSLSAGYTELKVHVQPAAHRAAIELTGDQQTLNQVTASMRGGTWEIKGPEDAPGSISVRGGSVTMRGGSFQNVSFGGRGTTFVSGGTVITGGGRGRRGQIIVDGVDVTDVVNKRRGEQGSGELTAVLVLPAESTLTAKIGEGEIRIEGAPLDAQIETHNAGVISRSAQLTGSVQVHDGDLDVETSGALLASTHNGSINLRAAGGQTIAATHNGGLRIHVTASVPVNASSHNGSIDITKSKGTSPQIMTSAHNGSVRKP